VLWQLGHVVDGGSRAWVILLEHVQVWLEPLWRGLCVGRGL